VETASGLSAGDQPGPGLWIYLQSYPGMQRQFPVKNPFCAGKREAITDPLNY